MDHAIRARNVYDGKFDWDPSFSGETMVKVRPDYEDARYPSNFGKAVRTGQGLDEFIDDGVATPRSSSQNPTINSGLTGTYKDYTLTAPFSISFFALGQTDDAALFEFGIGDTMCALGMTGGEMEFAHKAGYVDDISVTASFASEPINNEWRHFAIVVYEDSFQLYSSSDPPVIKDGLKLLATDGPFLVDGSRIAFKNFAVFPRALTSVEVEELGTNELGKTPVIPNSNMSFNYPDVTPAAYLATRNEIWDLTNEASCQWLRSYLPRFESFVIEGISNNNVESLGDFTSIWYEELKYYVPSLPDNPAGVQRAVALFVNATADFKTDAVLVQGSNSIAYCEDFVSYGPVQIFDLQSAADAVQLDVHPGEEPLSVTLPGGIVELQLSSVGLPFCDTFALQFDPTGGTGDSFANSYTLLIPLQNYGSGVYTLSASVYYSTDYDGQKVIFHSRWYRSDGSVIVDSFPFTFVPVNQWNDVTFTIEVDENPEKANWYVGYPVRSSVGYMWITNLQFTTPGGAQLLADGTFPNGNNMAAYVNSESPALVQIVPTCPPFPSPSASFGEVEQRLVWSMGVPVSSKLYTADRIIEAIQSTAPEGVKFVRIDPLTMIYENQQPGDSNNLEEPYVFRNYNFTVTTTPITLPLTETVAVSGSTEEYGSNAFIVQARENITPTANLHLFTFYYQTAAYTRGSARLTRRVAEGDQLEPGDYIHNVIVEDKQGVVTIQLQLIQNGVVVDSKIQSVPDLDTSQLYTIDQLSGEGVLFTFSPTPLYPSALTLPGAYDWSLRALEANTAVDNEREGTYSTTTTSAPFEIEGYYFDVQTSFTWPLASTIELTGDGGFCSCSIEVTSAGSFEVQFTYPSSLGSSTVNSTYMAVNGFEFNVVVNVRKEQTEFNVTSPQGGAIAPFTASNTDIILEAPWKVDSITGNVNIIEYTISSPISVSFSVIASEVISDAIIIDLGTGTRNIEVVLNATPGETNMQLRIATTTPFVQDFPGEFVFGEVQRYAFIIDTTGIQMFKDTQKETYPGLQISVTPPYKIDGSVASIKSISIMQGAVTDEELFESYANPSSIIDFNILPSAPLQLPQYPAAYGAIVAEKFLARTPEISADNGIVKVIGEDGTYATFPTAENGNFPPNALVLQPGEVNEDTTSRWFSNEAIGLTINIEFAALGFTDYETNSRLQFRVGDLIVRMLGEERLQYRVDNSLTGDTAKWIANGVKIPSDGSSMQVTIVHERDFPPNLYINRERIEPFILEDGSLETYVETDVTRQAIVKYQATKENVTGFYNAIVLDDVTTPTARYVGQLVSDNNGFDGDIRLRNDNNATATTWESVTKLTYGNVDLLGREFNIKDYIVDSLLQLKATTETGIENVQYRITGVNQTGFNTVKVKYVVGAGNTFPTLGQAIVSRAAIVPVETKRSTRDLNDVMIPIVDDAKIVYAALLPNIPLAEGPGLYWESDTSRQLIVYNRGAADLLGLDPGVPTPLSYPYSALSPPTQILPLPPKATTFVISDGEYPLRVKLEDSDYKDEYGMVRPLVMTIVTIAVNNFDRREDRDLYLQVLGLPAENNSKFSTNGNELEHTHIIAKIPPTGVLIAEDDTYQLKLHEQFYGNIFFSVVDVTGADIANDIITPPAIPFMEIEYTMQFD